MMIQNLRKTPRSIWRSVEAHQLIRLNSKSSASNLQSQLKSHSHSQNLHQVLKTCHHIKSINHLSDSEKSNVLQDAYLQLLQLFSHFGLWTQFLLILKELDQQNQILNSLSSLPQFWFTLLSGFINCGKAPDLILSYISNHRLNLNPIPTSLLTPLLRASITENNLPQTLFLFREYLSQPLPVTDRLLISILTHFFALHGELRLAIEITNSYLLPFGPDEHELILNLLGLFRASIDRSDVSLSLLSHHIAKRLTTSHQQPDSTMYCYHHLSESHPQALAEALDEGLSLALLWLAYRHILPSLALKTITQLIQHHIPLTPSHLLPALGTLTRAPGGRMEDVLEILGRMARTCSYTFESGEEEWLEYHLLIGHLGGLEAYRHTLTQSQSPPSSSLDPPARLTVRGASDAQLDRSITLIRHLVGLDSSIPVILVNSVLKALVELGSRERARATYTDFFGSKSQLIPNERTREILLESELES